MALISASDATGLALVHDGDAAIHVARTAPLNNLAATLRRQDGIASGRSLGPAVGINLIIRNILHSTVTVAPTVNPTSGAFTLEGAVPGDVYLATPVTTGGAVAGPSFNLVSTPGMETSEGGLLILPADDQGGCFKAYLEPGAAGAYESFTYHYAGSAKPFTLSVKNVGAAVSIASCAVSWTGFDAGPTSLPSLAGAYEAGSAASPATKSHEFQLTANNAIPEGEDYIDVRATITLTDDGGTVWTDYVAYRFYRPENKVALSFYGDTLGATVMDPEGKASVLLGSYQGAFQEVVLPFRSEGYRVAVTHAGPTDADR